MFSGPHWSSNRSLLQQPDCTNTRGGTLIIQGITVLYLPLYIIYLSLPEAFALFFRREKTFLLIGFFNDDFVIQPIRSEIM